MDLQNGQQYLEETLKEPIQDMTTFYRKPASPANLHQKACLKKRQHPHRRECFQQWNNSNLIVLSRLALKQ